MAARHITNKVIDPIEYYFISFQSNSDIIAFCNKCEWFNKEEAHIGDRYIIKLNNDKDNLWYEILPVSYFKRILENEINIKSAIFNEFDSFFTIY